MNIRLEKDLPVLLFELVSASALASLPQVESAWNGVRESYGDARQRNIRSFAIRGPNSYIGWSLISLHLFRVLRLQFSSRRAFVCALVSVLALALTLPVWGGEQGNASASQVQGQVGSGRKFREIIGLQVKFYQGQPQSDLP